MATREVYEWSTVDASNNFPEEEGGWVELMNRSAVNNAARADMGALRRWYDDPEWLNLTIDASCSQASATQLNVVGNYATYFNAGRRVKITGGTPTPVYATVVSASWVDPNTQVVLSEFSGHTGVPATPTLVELHIIKSLNPTTWLDDIFIHVTTLTGVAIQAAIDALEAASGGVIVLEPKATYVIDAPLTIGLGASEGNIRIIGRGATLQAGTNLNDHIMEIDGAGAISANVVLEELIFDGNSANQSGGTGNSLYVGTATHYIWAQRCQFDDSYGDTINLASTASNIWLNECILTDMGNNGIQTAADAVYITRCTFVTPANGSSTQGECIAFSGSPHISDCEFTGMNHATDSQSGIKVDPTAKSGTITGCRFKGTGLNARGIWLEGDDTVIVGCTFDLFGANSEGVYGALSGGASSRNIIAGCNFIDADRAVQFTATAEDNVVTGCTFESCPYPYTDNGDRNRFEGNSLRNGIDGVNVAWSASDAEIVNNTIDTMSADGIAIAAGAARTLLLHNRTTGISGSHINDAASGTSEISGYSAALEEFALTTSILNLSITGTEALVSGGGGNDFLQAIAQLADGNRVWIVESAMVSGYWSSVEASVPKTILRLRHGTNSGTPTSDTQIAMVLIPAHDGVNPDEAWQVVFAQKEFTPASGDDVYLTAEDNAVALDLDFSGTDVGLDSLFRIRPK